ncbi:hypothetical protein ADUPG1_007889 [Aduncisulcus paluster]|uniref:Uncharacterized protein n=1 Tax=Aduncisulcus paluster TaxID=2918883 RepID=A0ABQ5KPY2_9EUKA|nr:hypothetical protein ADUPG1_007889 [Aduncisulcus paluster]
MNGPFYTFTEKYFIPRETLISSCPSSKEHSYLLYAFDAGDPVSVETCIHCRNTFADFSRTLCPIVNPSFAKRPLHYRDRFVSTLLHQDKRSKKDKKTTMEQLKGMKDHVASYFRLVKPPHFDRFHSSTLNLEMGTNVAFHTRNTMFKLSSSQKLNLDHVSSIFRCVRDVVAMWGRHSRLFKSFMFSPSDSSPSTHVYTTSSSSSSSSSSRDRRHHKEMDAKEILEVLVELFQSATSSSPGQNNSLRGLELRFKQLYPFGLRFQSSSHLKYGVRILGRKKKDRMKGMSKSQHGKNDILVPFSKAYSFHPYPFMFCTNTNSSSKQSELHSPSTATASDKIHQDEMITNTNTKNIAKIPRFNCDLGFSFAFQPLELALKLGEFPFPEAPVQDDSFRLSQILSFNIGLGKRKASPLFNKMGINNNSNKSYNSNNTCQIAPRILSLPSSSFSDPMIYEFPCSFSTQITRTNRESFLFLDPSNPSIYSVRTIIGARTTPPSRDDPRIEYKNEFVSINSALHHKFRTKKQSMVVDWIVKGDSTFSRYKNRCVHYGVGSHMNFHFHQSPDISVNDDSSLDSKNRTVEAKNRNDPSSSSPNKMSSSRVLSLGVDCIYQNNVDDIVNESKRSVLGFSQYLFNSTCGISPYIQFSHSWKTCEEKRRKERKIIDQNIEELRRNKMEKEEIGEDIYNHLSISVKAFVPFSASFFDIEKASPKSFFSPSKPLSTSKMPLNGISELFPSPTIGIGVGMDIPINLGITKKKSKAKGLFQRLLNRFLKK